MASLRDAIVAELVTRLSANAGWTVRARAGEEATNVPVLAIVSLFGESKRPTDSLFYECTLRVGVLLLVRQADASPTTDGGNPYRYLDRIVALAEKAIHASEWPNVERVQLAGHEVEDPTDDTTLAAELNLDIAYRHNINDPDTYAPGYVP